MQQAAIDAIMSGQGWGAVNAGAFKQLLNTPGLPTTPVAGVLPAAGGPMPVAGVPQQSSGGAPTGQSWLHQAPGFVQDSVNARNASIAAPAPAGQQAAQSVNANQQAQLDAFLKTAHPEAATALRLAGFAEGGHTDDRAIV